MKNRKNNKKQSDSDKIMRIIKARQESFPEKTVDEDFMLGVARSVQQPNMKHSFPIPEQDKSKLRQMLDSLNDDSSNIDKYKEVSYNVSDREFGTGHMSDHDKNKSNDILKTLKNIKHSIKQPKSKVEPQSGISRYEELKYELEEIELELSHTTDFLDGALAQPGESPELLAYISEMTQVQAELVKEVKQTRVKLGLDKA